MKAKIKFSKTEVLKLSMSILVTSALLFIFSCEKKRSIQENKTVTKPPETIVNDQQNLTTKEETEYFVIEESASFQDSSNQGFSEWIQKHIEYPPVARKSGITGKVYVQFSVNTEGDVIDVKVVHSADPLLDKEAVRVVKSSPKWEHGAKKKGTKVNDQFTIPISFALQ